MKLPNAYPNKNIDVDKLIRFLYQYRNYIVDFNHQQFIYQRDVLYPKFYKEPGKKEMYVYAVMSKLSGQKIDLRFEFCIFNVQKSELAGKLDYSIHFYFYKTDVYTTQRTPALILYSRDLQTLFTVAKWLWGDRVDSKFTKLAKTALNSYKLIGENNLDQLALWYEENDPSVIVGLSEETRIKDLLKFIGMRDVYDRGIFIHTKTSIVAAIMRNLTTYLPQYSAYRDASNSNSTAADRVLTVLYTNTVQRKNQKTRDEIETKTITVFEDLYTKFRDSSGAGNFTELVHLLFRIWAKSSYSSISNKVYNDYNKSSSIIPYSVKQFYFKSTGMQFVFNLEKVVKLSRKTSAERKVEYHLYQPVVPVDFDKIFDIKYLEQMFIMPAFFLKMLDDKINIENLVKTLNLLLDVLTISSGIGVLARFRYLRYLTKIEQVFVIFVGSVEIGAGSLNILLDIAEENKYPSFCKKLRILLIVAEITFGVLGEAVAKPLLKLAAADVLLEYSKLSRYIQDTETMTRAKQQLEAIVTPEKYPLGVPEKIGDDLYMLRKNGDEVFRGTKKEVDELVERLKKMPDTDAKKYLDDLVESRKLDDYINGQGYKFTKLGYRFTHSMKKSKDGVIDVTMFLIDKNGQKLIQGFSNINKGVLDNVFEVSIQQHEVSTAMYKLLDKIGFNKVVGNYYGNSTLNVNYIEFMKVFKTTNDKVKAALSTPAGKALNNSLDNKFLPEVTKIDDINKKITINWTKI